MLQVIDDTDDIDTETITQEELDNALRWEVLNTEGNTIFDIGEKSRC